MKAIVFEQYGGPEVLAIRELPVPEPGSDQIRIQVKAFGVNRAESHMRAGHFGEVSHISGIECVGLVDADPSGKLRRGQTVAAVVGGLGRSLPGSYAEYTCVPASNVFALDTQLGWAQLAAIPESYATAWSALFDNMALEPRHTVVIRGGTSALGQAAIAIAVDYGATVFATTRRKDRIGLLEDLGATRVFIDDGALARQIQGIDGVLDIVGNAVLRDSVRMIRKNGTLCEVGFMGGMEPVEHFNPLLDLPSGVNLRFYGTAFVLGTPEFPLSDIPMQRIVEKISAGAYRTKPSRVFPFDAIQEAHRLMESDQAAGKIVVTV
ncbi:MAG TPA: zinc-binding dehydrogenase [Gemmatimonadaceae bacterium]|nr:zinc-binding dehydrogenase [Gemmatimonadaceae bacterium]